MPEPELFLLFVRRSIARVSAMLSAAVWLLFSMVNPA
jgi:hypothetical protein